MATTAPAKSLARARPAAVILTPSAEARIAELMEKSLMLVTALAPHIGYDRAAQIAKTASHDGLTLRQAALQSGFVTEQQFDGWIVPIDMTRPDPVA